MTIILVSVLFFMHCFPSQLRRGLSEYKSVSVARAAGKDVSSPLNQ